MSQLSYIADSVVIKGLALEMSGTATRRMAVGCHRAVLQTASLAQAAPNGQQPACLGQPADASDGRVLSFVVAVTCRLQRLHGRVKRRAVNPFRRAPPDTSCETSCEITRLSPIYSNKRLSRPECRPAVILLLSPHAPHRRPVQLAAATLTA